jgi:hypothetical protein
MARKRTVKKPKPEPPASGGPDFPIARYGGWIAVIGIALLLIAFFNPIFFGGKTFQPPDQIASMSHRPYIQESFASGGSFVDRYPLWTPYIFSGMPSFGSLIAAPHTNPMSTALGWIPGVFRVVTYYFLLGVFVWLLLRRRGLGNLSAFFGGATYIFCAHLATMIMFGHNSKIATLVFLPLILLATDEIWKKPGLRWASILALAVGTMLVTSHLQISYYTFLAAGVYLVVASVFGVRSGMGYPRILARWGTFAAALGVGLAASSVIFLSVREYAGHSIRGGTGGGLPYDYATNWSLHPLEMTTFLVPSFLGFGKATYWGWMPFTDFPHYMGILPLFLAVLTLAVWPREKFHAFLGVLGLLALITAFGKHLPVLYDLMFNFFPYFDKFRVPSMITVLLQFAVAVLAAVGLERLMRGSDTPPAVVRRRFLATAGGFAAVVLGLGLLSVSGSLDDAIAKRVVERTPFPEGTSPAQISGYASRQVAEIRSMIDGDFVIVLAVLALGAGLVYARMQRRVPAWVMGAGVLVLTLADLWRVDAKPAEYTPRTGDPNVFRKTPAVEYLQGRDELYRVFPLTAESNNNWFAYFKIPSVAGYHPAKLKIYQDLIDDRGPVGLRKTLGAGNLGVLNMLNARYVIADPQTGGALAQAFADRLVPVFRGDRWVLENREALPRFWFVPKARVVADPEAQLRELASPAWSPGDEALLFEDVGPVGGTGSVAVSRHGPREIDLRVEAAGRALLVMSEIYYEPGWKATLDGEPVEIHRTDYVLRSVVVPPGSHTLELRFDPTSFERGVTLSAAAYGVIALGLIVSFLPRRRRRDETGSRPV